MERNNKGQFLKGGNCKENHPNWKGGKPKCPICDKILSTYKTKACPKHKEFSKEHRKKLGLKSIGRKPMLGHYHSEKTKQKMRNKIVSEEVRKRISEAHKGEKAYNYIKDRTKLVKRQERNDYAYCEWRHQIFKRDRHVCRINDKNCFGRMIAHHILPWKDFPELRYNINNGITLCQAHHPRKRAEEKRLIPFFQGLVPVSNELIC